MVWVNWFTNLLFHFVVISSWVLLSLSTSLLACILSVLFPSSVPALLLSLIFLQHLSHISLVSSALFSVSLHLHFIPSLVKFVFKPVLSSRSFLVRLFLIQASPVLLCLLPGPLVFAAVFWFALSFCPTLVFSFADLFDTSFYHLPFHCSHSRTWDFWLLKLAFGFQPACLCVSAFGMSNKLTK